MEEGGKTGWRIGVQKRLKRENKLANECFGAAKRDSYLTRGQ